MGNKNFLGSKIFWYLAGIILFVILNRSSLGLKILWHLLGIILLVILVVLVRKLIDNLRGTTVARAVASSIVGILAGLFGYLLLCALFLSILWTFPSLGSSRPSMIPGYIITVCSLFFTYVCGIQAARLLRTFGYRDIVVNFSLLTTTYFLFQPVGYSWLVSLFPSLEVW